MKKYKVSIISVDTVLQSITSAIDWDKIDICNLFSVWEELQPYSRKLFKSAYQPLDMLQSKAMNAEYFLVNMDHRIHSQIMNKLIANGINKDKIIDLRLFGSLSHYNYLYFLQWQYLISNVTTPPPCMLILLLQVILIQGLLLISDLCNLIPV